MSDYDHSAARLQRVAAQEAELERLRQERARRLTESLADHDTTATQPYRNTKRLRNRTADAMRDQEIE